MRLKPFLLAVVCTLVTLIIACHEKEKKSEEINTEPVNTLVKYPEGTMMQIVRIKSALSHEDLMRVAKERAPRFAAIDGLIQKYYLQLDAPGEYSGIYVWDSMESIKAFKNSDLAATIGEAYKLKEPPSIEIVPIMFQLR